MNTAKHPIAERLLTSRVGHREENGNSLRLVSGAKLREAANYAKSSRLALLNFVKEVYAGQENVDQHTDHVLEVLSMAQQFENLRMRLDVKASIFGI